MTPTLDALCLDSLTDQARLIQTRQISPVELTDAYLDRIQRLDPRLRTYLTVTADRARGDARQAEHDIGAGAYRGPLHGIPLAHKDLFDTAGIRTTAGSRVLWDNVPAHDATAMARLADAGSVLLGKLMMYEFASGMPYLEDDPPPALNPWNLERTPGGSSSGSAAAVAAGLCAASMGSDTAGSIRSPAHQSGVVGLKPTYGRVSRHGVVPLSTTLDHVGPLARSVRDAAAVLQVVAGYDERDPTSSRAPVPDYLAALTGDIRGLRVGVPRQFIAGVAGIEPDVRAAFDAALDVLRELGARLVDVVLPPGAAATEAPYMAIMLPEAVASHKPWIDDDARRARYGRGFWVGLQPGFAFTAAEYVAATRARAALAQAMADTLRDVAVLATPALTVVAPTFAQQAAAPRGSRAAFTRLFNMSGQPSLSVPCGFDRTGLPIGLLISGSAFDEATVLQVADAYERATTWHTQHPPLATSVLV